MFCMFFAWLQVLHGVLRQGILLLPSGRPTAAENGAAIISAIYLSRVYMLTNCPIPLKSIEIDRIHVCLAKEKKFDEIWNSHIWF